MNYIDKIYYINLDKRTDRREEIEYELKRLDIPKEKVKRFTAIEFNPGFIGCCLSHYHIMNEGYNDDYDNILILEDDFLFMVSKEELENNLKYIFEVRRFDKPWDVIMFSYNIGFPEHRIEDIPGDPILGKIKYAQTASGYLVNKHYFKKLRDNLYEASHKLIDTGEHWLYLNDVYWRILQETDEWYYFKKRIGKQRASVSDNNEDKAVVDYGC